MSLMTCWGWVLSHLLHPGKPRLRRVTSLAQGLMASNYLMTSNVFLYPCFLTCEVEMNPLLRRGLKEMTDVEPSSWLSTQGTRWQMNPVAARWAKREDWARLFLVPTFQAHKQGGGGQSYQWGPARTWALQSVIWFGPCLTWPQVTLVTYPF